MDDVTFLPGAEHRPPVAQPLVAHVLDRLVIADDYGREFCGHARIEVRDDRTVRCRDCNITVDAVDWILGLAKWWSRYSYAMGDAQARVRRLNEDVERLKAKERNARARIRKLEPAAEKKLRQTLERSASKLWRIRDALHALGVRDSLVDRDLLDVSGQLKLAADRLHPVDAHPVAPVAS